MNFSACSQRSYEIKKDLPFDSFFNRAGGTGPAPSCASVSCPNKIKPIALDVSVKERREEDEGKKMRRDISFYVAFVL